MEGLFIATFCFYSNSFILTLFEYNNCKVVFTLYANYPDVCFCNFCAVAMCVQTFLG